MLDVSLIWYLDALVTYTDNTTRSVAVLKDQSGLRYVNTSSIAGFADAKTSIELQALLTALGIGVTPKALGSTIRSVVFRFSAITESGNFIHVIGGDQQSSRSPQLAYGPSSPLYSDDVAACKTALNADSDYAATMASLAS